MKMKKIFLLALLLSGSGILLKAQDAISYQTTPKGWTIWQQVEQYMRRVYQENGYQEVKAPQILDRALWEKSGHWENYKDNMFTTESENRAYALKPMNCPGHVQIYNAGLHSYRELPLRYGEFGQIGRAHV